MGNGGALRDDYKYSDEELQEWRKKIDKLKQKGKVENLYMFFNNCHLGQAVGNATDMRELLKS